MKGHRRLRNERGSVLLFMIGTLLFLLVFGGFAIDLSFLSVAKGELQRSMDAAALAGAGQLGFDDSVFGAVRTEAAKFALLNPTRANLSPTNLSGAINLDPNGDITLGVWDGATFTPKLDGSEVNAVRAQYATEVPTAFLRILGFNTLPVSASAIAVANPAANPGNACVAPIALSDCAFTAGGSYTSGGCGAPISFISSSSSLQGTPPPGTNTAAWANFLPAPAECDPEVDPPDCTEEEFGWKEYLTDTINSLADNTCEASTASTDDVTSVNNGLLQSVVNVLETAFLANHMATSAEPDWIPVTDADGNEVYKGPGWKLTTSVINTSGGDEANCPAGAITGEYTIDGWTNFVMTQVINKGECAVENHYPGNPWDELCLSPEYGGKGTGTPETVPTNANAFRAIFGYFSCELIPSLPTPGPAPRSSIATGRKLVQ